MHVWRVSRLSGLALAATLLASLVAPLGPVALAHADPIPSTATITSPVEGDTVSDVVPVMANGTVDLTTGDAPASMLLFVDSRPDPVGGTQLCPSPADGTCPVQFNWPTSAEAAGPHTLLVVLTTAMAATVPSATVTVTVPPPPAPTVVLNSPPATAIGPVTFNATGTDAGAPPGAAASLQLLVGMSPDTLVPYLSPVACSDASSCTQDLPWDSTGINGTRTIEAQFTSADGTVNSDPAVVTAANPGPTLTLSAPDPGSVHSGVVTVSGTGVVHGSQNDTAGSMQRLVDDADFGPAVTCPAVRTCDDSFNWDSTGLTGSHTVGFTFTTTKGKSKTTTVPVTIDSPGPTAAITSPADGGAVSGNAVPVTAHGSVNPTQTDTAASMQLLVDGSGAGNPVVTCPSAGSSRDCDLTLTWDATGKTGAHTFQVRFKTTRGRSGDSPPVHVTATTEPPVASITSPANAAIVMGTVTVATHGAINPSQNDSPTKMQLFVDSVSLGTQPCVASSDPRSCSLSYAWDATGLSGTHTMFARFTTAKGLIVDSAVTTVTVVSPAPAAAVTSPRAGTTVHRAATVVVSGTVDPSQSDTPATMVLTVDGVPQGAAVPCLGTAANPRACVASFAWDTAGLTGRHLLGGLFTTTRGRSATAPASSVYVYGGTRIVLSGAKVQRAGLRMKISGRVTALANRSAVTGVKVKVLLVPAVGKAKTLYVRTDGFGYFTLTVKPALNTTVQATMLALPYYGTSHTFLKAKVRANPVCHAQTTVRHGRSDHGVCKVTGLLKGTKVTLQYGFKGKWYTIGTGKAPSSSVPFRFTFARPGKYLLRLLFANTRAFLATTGPSVKVTVR